MTDQKMIQHSQLSCAANCFLSSPREKDDDDHPTTPYFSGQNWKSAMSAATELEQYRISEFLDYRRIMVQMEDSVNRLDLCHTRAKKVEPASKKKELVERGSVGAAIVPAHLQTPFDPKPTSRRFSDYPRLFENSHVSEHTGSLGLPADNDHEKMYKSAVYLDIVRLTSEKCGRQDPQFSADEYHDHMLRFIRSPDSPGGNGKLFNTMSLYLSNIVPKTMAGIQNEILNGTEEEKKEAMNRLSEMENIYRRNQLKEKLINTAEKNARKAHDMADRHREFKKSEFLREQIEQFGYIKKRGGENYMEIGHHFSAVPRYMVYEFRTERLLDTGVWNSIAPGNGVKRERPGSVWRDHDPHGVHSSLRMVSNVSSGFHEKYVTKASYGPPTSIHIVDDSAEPLEVESDAEESDSDESDESEEEE